MVQAPCVIDRSFPRSTGCFVGGFRAASFTRLGADHAIHGVRFWLRSRAYVLDHQVTELDEGRLVECLREDIGNHLGRALNR